MNDALLSLLVYNLAPFSERHVLVFIFLICSRNALIKRTYLSRTHGVIAQCVWWYIAPMQLGFL
jgi:hypothetical protein